MKRGRFRRSLVGHVEKGKEDTGIIDTGGEIAMKLFRNLFCWQRRQLYISELLCFLTIYANHRKSQYH